MMKKKLFNRFAMLVSMLALLIIPGLSHTILGVNTVQISEYDLPSANTKAFCIDVGVNSNVWISETEANKICKFVPSSKTFVEFSTSFKPGDIVCNPHDKLVWFTEGDYGNGHYGYVKSNGVVKEFACNLPAASTVDNLLDPENNYWFNGWDSQRLMKTNSSGGTQVYILPSFGYTSGLAEDPEGILWMTIVGAYEYSPRLVRFDPKLGVPGTSNGFTEIPLPYTNQETIRRPLASGGKIYFLEIAKSAIGCYDPKSGQFNEYLTPTAAAGPSAMAADRFGRIWFTEGSANNIAMLDLRTGLITEYPVPTPNSSPGGIAIDLVADVVYFTEFNANRIGQLTIK
jgi:streptogramin lyase